MGLVRRRRFIVLRLLAFGWVYATMECLGLARALGLLEVDLRDLRHREVALVLARGGHHALHGFKNQVERRLGRTLQRRLTARQRVQVDLLRR